MAGRVEIHHHGREYLLLLVRAGPTRSPAVGAGGGGGGGDGPVRIFQPLRVTHELATNAVGWSQPQHWTTIPRCIHYLGMAQTPATTSPPAAHFWTIIEVANPGQRWPETLLAAPAVATTSRVSTTSPCTVRALP